MRTQRYEPTCGENIYEACQKAVKMAKDGKCEVAMKFNDIELKATPDADPVRLTNEYHVESERRHQEYIKSPEYKRRQEEYERQQRERKARLNDLLSSAPEHMSLRDAEAWKKSCAANTDGYGGAVMFYAERWARLMEARMDKGEKLSTIADDCSHIADEEGITGFMYGCAVSTLSHVWKHGEALRIWHNLKTQIKDEGEKANESGGVLNPAILTINN